MRVLIALDDSPQSWDAFEYAMDRFPEATFVVLTVTDDGGFVLSRAAEDDRRRESAIHAEATEVADVFDVSIETVTVSGDPDEAIVAYAEEHDIDHVVLGSHGRTGISRLVLGSTAEQVVRSSPVPVTVVR